MAVCCSPLISCFYSMLLRYYASDFEMVPVAPIITGVNFVFTFNMRCISVVRYLYFVESSQLPSLSHFSFPKLQHLSTYIFPFNYHGLCCPVYYYGWFCRFAPYLNLQDLSLPVLLPAHITVHCLILPHFPYSC